jgi:hypothetical protein
MTPSPVDHLKRVEALCSDPMVGFIPSVVHHWDGSTSKYGNPILKVIAALWLVSCDTSAFTHDAQSHIEGSVIADDV